MTDKTVAKRYAKALFALGEEQGKAQVFADDFKELKELISGNGEVRHMLENQSIGSASKKEAMKAILVDADKTVKDFICLVLDKRRGSFFVDICDSYQSLMEDAANVVLAKVTSAVPLTDEQLDQIADKFSDLVNRKVIAQLEVNPALIGGVQVMIGDKLYDGSIAQKIKQLSNNLKEQRC